MNALHNTYIVLYSVNIRTSICIHLFIHIFLYLHMYTKNIYIYIFMLSCPFPQYRKHTKILHVLYIYIYALNPVMFAKSSPVLVPWIWGKDPKSSLSFPWSRVMALSIKSLVAGKKWVSLNYVGWFRILKVNGRWSIQNYIWLWLIMIEPSSCPSNTFLYVCEQFYASRGTLFFGWIQLYLTVLCLSDMYTCIWIYQSLINLLYHHTS